MKRSILAVFSDPHGGHELGLCNPETVLEDDSSGEIVQKPIILNAAQERLWDIYAGAIGEIKILAGKSDVYVKCLGDATHGNKYIAEQLTTKMSDQLIIGEYLFYPWFQIPTLKAIRLTKGTDAHEYGEGSSSIIISKMLKNKFPKVDVRAVYHGLARLGGVFIDYSHHGPTSGIRRWLEGNEARYYLRSIMMTEIECGHIPPHLVLRGHVHSYVKEYLSIQANGTEYESWMVVVPSMDLISGFARKAAKSPYRIKNGVIAFEMLNDRIYDIHFFGNTLDVRTVEEF